MNYKKSPSEIERCHYRKVCETIYVERAEEKSRGSEACYTPRMLICVEELHNGNQYDYTQCLRKPDIGSSYTTLSCQTQ